MEHSKREMIAFEKALKLVISSAKPVLTEQVTLLYALNRVLAEDIFSDIDMPPFNKSAMDGFACRQEDLKNDLGIIDEIPAGTIPSKIISRNQCARIMTGAMVPEGADFVIMKEYIDEIAPNQIHCNKEIFKTNICYTGEDVKAGALVIKKGEIISPSMVAILASVGCSDPLVFKIPTVAIISTGNELVEPNEIPGISKIRNSNSYQLAAQTQQLGVRPDYLGIVRDDEESLENVLAMALEKYDVTIISGGVSVGDFDFVPKILNQQNVNIKVHGMDVRPGKHLLFGQRANHFIFGMPGNPVSSFVQFEVLVRPFLFALMGRTKVESLLHLPIEEDYLRKKGDQLIFVPVTLTSNGTVLPLEYHGSAHIHAYIHAQAIMEIPKSISFIKKGEIVSVRPL
ncbi:MAG: molybdopterin molybdotransferase MoeA [Mariniphaga sp.]|nr:molybdopterin molybdotransferase MoeA [Mariniphaga sp.]